MKDSIKILFVEDVPRDAELIWRELAKNEIVFEKILVDNRKDFIAALKSLKPDLIISDFSLPQFNGMQALTLRNETCPVTPFILVTGSNNEMVAVDCMKAGADDYILKDNLSRLVPAIRNALYKISLLSEKKKSEKERKKVERTLQDLIDNNPISIQILDINGFTLKVNQAFFKLFGSVPPSDYSVFSDIQLKEKGFAELLERIKNCEVVQFPDMQFNPHDSVSEMPDCLTWIKAIGFSLVDGNGEPEKIVLMHQDITDRKLSEEELIKAKEKAEEGDRLKTAFLHNISHEIRTPMNAIVGFSALLGEPDVDTKSLKDYIEVINQSSNHLLSIISDIVDFSNIEANLVKIVLSKTNINSTLQSLIEQFILKANEKKIYLVCETALSDSDALVLTDCTKLNQILINLINNAIKFTDIGYVNVGCVLTDKFLEFNVSDTGIGISEEHHQKIFDRFYQVQQSVSRLYEGTGLGLAISKAHVERMGGKIWLTSEPGKGTSFIFTVPYVKLVVETSIDDEKRVVKDFVFPVKKTILVAEDSDSNFKLIEYFLSNVNTDLIRAVNGKEAAEKCLSNKNIDLVLMDIKMPVMDGYTAVKLIREKNSAIPIIAQTAYTDDESRAIEAGCSGFITKPFDKMKLINSIQEVIKKR